MKNNPLKPDDYIQQLYAQRKLIHIQKKKKIVIASQIGKDGTIRTKQDTLFFLFAIPFFYIYIYMYLFSLFVFYTFVLWDS